MFAHLAAVPAFISNLNLFVALAPIGTVRYLQIDLWKYLKRIPFAQWMEDAGVGAFLPYDNAPGLNYDFCDLF